jgi:hypothetical protein
MNYFVVFSCDMLGFESFACCMCTMHIPTFNTFTTMFLFMQLLSYVNYTSTSHL